MLCKCKSRTLCYESVNLGHCVMKAGCKFLSRTLCCVNVNLGHCVMKACCKSLTLLADPDT